MIIDITPMINDADTNWADVLMELQRQMNFALKAPSEPRVRKRTNMATSVKGIKTPDVTVESYEDTSYEDHMALYDKLVTDTQSRASATPVVADAAN